MAIEIKYNSEFEYVFENAYVKIEDVKFSIERDECWIEVRIYANENSRKAKEVKNVNGVGKLSVRLLLSDLKIKEFTIDNIKKACYIKLMLDHILFKNGKEV